MKGLKTASIAHKKLNVEAVKKRSTKTEKVSKNIPGAPKRPPTAFFVFMEDFRKSYKENFPDNKSVAIVAKSGGEKWKSMSESDKAPYVAMAEKRKTEYVKVLGEFNSKLNGNGMHKTEDSEKSTSEVHDDCEQEASS